MLHTSEPDKVAALLAELPTGAVKAWSQLEWLSKSTSTPVYMLILESAENNPVLQFANPADLKVTADAIFYSNTNERVATKDFFNKNSLPTFMFFDNFMHLKAFEVKLGSIGYKLHYRKF